MQLPSTAIINLPTSAVKKKFGHIKLIMFPLISGWLYFRRRLTSLEAEMVWKVFSHSKFNLWPEPQEYEKYSILGSTTRGIGEYAAGAVLTPSIN